MHQQPLVDACVASKSVMRSGDEARRGRIPATIEEVVEFYDQGGNDNPFRDRELRPLRLTKHEKAALVAFLQSLSGQIREGLE